MVSTGPSAVMRAAEAAQIRPFQPKLRPLADGFDVIDVCGARLASDFAAPRIGGEELGPQPFPVAVVGLIVFPAARLVDDLPTLSPRFPAQWPMDGRPGWHQKPLYCMRFVSQNSGQFSPVPLVGPLLKRVGLLGSPAVRRLVCSEARHTTSGGCVKYRQAERASSR